MLNVIVLAAHCGLLVDHEVLAAIVRVESKGNPYALAVNGGYELVRAPRNGEEAVATARWLQADGYNFDAGLAQVNSANLARLGLDAMSVFDPCENLRAASRVLAECHERALARMGRGERAVTAALSCYNTGDFTRGVSNGYVAAVRANASRRLVLRALVSRTATETSARPAPQCERQPAVVERRITRPARREEAFAEPLADTFGEARGAALLTPAPAAGSTYRERLP